MRLGCGYIALVLLALECGLMSTQSLAGSSSSSDASFDFFPEVKSFEPASQSNEPRVVKKSVSSFHAERKAQEPASVPEIVSEPKVVSAPKIISEPKPTSSAKLYALAENDSAPQQVMKQQLQRSKRIAYKPVTQPKKITASIQSAAERSVKKVPVLKLNTTKPIAEQQLSLAKIKNVKINLAVNRNKSTVAATVNDLKLKPSLASMVRINSLVANEKRNGNANSGEQGSIKVNAVFGDRIDTKKIAAKKEKIKIMTTADTGVDPNKVSPAKAVRSMFVAPPKKMKALAAGKTTALPSLLPKAISLSEEQQAKKVVAELQPQPKPQQQKQDMPVAAVQAQSKPGMIDSSEADKQQSVKVFSGDLNRNELFILGENDAVPEHLVENPETEMAVLGGDMNEGSRKVMEFKLTALKIARERAAKELAERQANAKALADLEVEEKEAARQLAQAQKTLEDMRKLKEWQKQKEKNMAKIAQDAGPDYKKAIVHTVVPADINVNAPAKKPKNTYVPIEQIALSVEKITDEMNDGDVAKIPASTATTQPAKADASLKRQDVAVQNNKAEHRKKLAKKRKSALEVERISEKQINQEIKSIKSGKAKRVSKKKSRSRARLAAASSSVKITGIDRSVIDYESDRVVINSLS